MSAQPLAVLTAACNAAPLLQVLEIYEDMIRTYIAPMFKDDVIVYQKRPTFRVQLPNNTAVPSDLGGDPERPGLHRDSDFNHPLGEINFWVPFTPTLADNTIWTESEVDKGDFHPVLTDNGNILRFYGNQVRCRGAVCAGVHGFGGWGGGLGYGGQGERATRVQSRG